MVKPDYGEQKNSPLPQAVFYTQALGLESFKSFCIPFIFYPKAQAGER
jgi:hypothetical protein